MFVLEWRHPSNSFLGFYRQGELYQQTFTPCKKTSTILSYLLGKLCLLGRWSTNLKKMEIQSILVAYER